MKRFLLASCVAVFLLGTGNVARATDDWKGFYIGGNIGAARGSSDARTTTVFSPTGYFAMSSVPAIANVGKQHLEPFGITGGGQGGYNFQTGHIVLGAEADFGAMNMSDSKANTGIYPCCAPTNFTITQSVSTGWLLTARPRVGFTAGHLLFYATAGMAMTSANYKALFTDTFATAHENGGVDQTRTGWIGGGGIEFHVGSHSHVSLKGECLYAGFGQVSKTSTNLTAFKPLIAFPTNVFTHTDDLHALIARFGFNYRF